MPHARRRAFGGFPRSGAGVRSSGDFVSVSAIVHRQSEVFWKTVSASKFVLVGCACPEKLGVRLFMFLGGNVQGSSTSYIHCLKLAIESHFSTSPNRARSKDSLRGVVSFHAMSLACANTSQYWLETAHAINTPEFPYAKFHTEGAA